MIIRNLGVVSALALMGFATATTSGVTSASIDFTNAKSDIWIRNGFVSGGTTFTKNRFQQWNGGQLKTFIGSTLTTYGWGDQIPTETGNNISGNPDRGDTTTAFSVNGSGRLNEVFSNSNKNLNWIIDGEDNGFYSLDMIYGGGKFIEVNPTQTQLFLLERGGNSKIRIHGIRMDGSETAGFVLDRLSTLQGTNAGFQIDTREIGSAQNVHGVGLKLDWNGLVAGEKLKGFRFYALDGYRGPDLVGVASTEAVPEPGTLLALGAGASALIARRRRK